MTSPTLTSIPGGDGAPPEPDWRRIFTEQDDIDVAAGNWAIVTSELREAGTLSVANGHAIRRLVELSVQYEHASRHVAEHGSILKPVTKKAKTGQWNPHWSVMRQADKNMMAAEAELGIAPIRRAKAGKVQRGKKAPRAADKFLRPVSVSK
jgi:P27 family predicted phage terminase small subunit